MSLGKKARTLAIGASAIALASIGTAASAHMVQFGWQETAAGTVLWAEHWHGDLPAPYSDNGGLHITDTATMGTITVQWAGILNNTLEAAIPLTGSQDDPLNCCANTYNDWMFTAPIPLGNGIYDFFTGTNCCVDTMGSPVRVTITGITTQPPGIGNVPEPSTWAMMLIGFGAAGAALRRRKVRVGGGNAASRRSHRTGVGATIDLAPAT
jgi:hypothetical protein